MKLADLKKVAVRKQMKIRFALPGGMECVVTEQGIAQVPGLAGIPAFDLEEAVAGAGSFTLEPAVGGKKTAAPQQASAAQLAAMAGGDDQPHTDEHEE